MITTTSSSDDELSSDDDALCSISDPEPIFNILRVHTLYHSECVFLLLLTQQGLFVHLSPCIPMVVLFIITILLLIIDFFFFIFYYYYPAEMMIRRGEIRRRGLRRADRSPRLVHLRTGDGFRLPDTSNGIVTLLHLDHSEACLSGVVFGAYDLHCFGDLHLGGTNNKHNKTYCALLALVLSLLWADGDVWGKIC